MKDTTKDTTNGGSSPKSDTPNATHSKLPVTCHACGKVIKTGHGLFSHMASAHKLYYRYTPRVNKWQWVPLSDTPVPEGGCNCPICGVHLGSDHGLGRHMKAAHGLKMAKLWVDIKTGQVASIPRLQSQPTGKAEPVAVTAPEPEKVTAPVEVKESTRVVLKYCPQCGYGLMEHAQAYALVKGLTHD